MTIMNHYTAVISEEDGWFIGCIAEVPGVNCQERDLPTLRISLKEVLQEALEFNRQDARAGVGENLREEKIVIPA